MSITTRIRSWFDRKSAALAFVSPWRTVTWSDLSFERMGSEGYKKNAAVYQCIQRLALGYSEPPPIVKNLKGEPQPTSPLQRLLNRPNPMMTHGELQNYIIHYKALGGQCYAHIVRNRLGMPVELWPYHAGQIRPVPGRTTWVDGYEYDRGDGEKVRIPVEDIIHFKWPSVDPFQPWVALAPLTAVAREVDSDSEMTRYLYALLVNDAAPRGVVTLPTGTTLSPTQATRLRDQFHLQHGGDNRGGVVILEQGATFSRTSLNMQELAFDALRRVPEARIAGAFGVPAILAGLYVGLEKATYANFKEAREQLTQDTYVPLWKADAQELTLALGDDALVVEYDLQRVAALQEDETEKYTRAVQLFDAGVTTKNEVRIYLGFPRVKDLVRDDPDGDVFKTDTAAPTPQQPIIDVTPVPPVLTDGKRAVKARDDSDERAMRRTVEGYFEEQGRIVMEAL